MKSKHNGNGHSAFRLPDTFAPLLENPAGFIARMEGESLILTPRKAQALPTVAQGAGAHTKASNSGEPGALVGRPSFLYTVKDRRLSLEQAKRYGLSPTRLKVLRAILEAKKGLQARQIMTRCKLPHGSVQQTLHWLRQHEMVDAAPVTS